MSLGLDVFVEFVFDAFSLLGAELVSYFYKVPGEGGVLDLDCYLEPFRIFRFEIGCDAGNLILTRGEQSGIQIIAGAVEGALGIVFQGVVPLVDDGRRRPLLYMTGFADKKLGVNVHQGPDSLVFAVGKFRVANKTCGSQILRQFRIFRRNDVKMSVLLDFLQTPGFIQDFRFGCLLMFGQ